MKPRTIVLIVLEVLVLILGIVAVVWALNHDVSEIGESVVNWGYEKAIKGALGISVELSGVEEGPSIEYGQGIDFRQAYGIADDAGTVVSMLEKAGWQHTLLGDTTHQERLLGDDPFDVQLRDLAAQNDHWWFYREDDPESYNGTFHIYQSNRHLTMAYTLAVYFPDLNTLYFRLHVE